MHIVTGAAGFIGSHVTEALLERGDAVVGIDSFHPYYSPDIKRENLRQVRETAEQSDGELRFVEGSILDEDDLAELPPEPEFVFHEAAIAGVRYSIDHPLPYSRINVLGTAMLLDRLEDVDNFVFASSSSVYGEVPAEELPVTEERDPEPIAPYPLSKVQAEQVVQLYSRLYGFSATILRYFSVYGPRQRPDEAFTKFIGTALKNETLPIYGDGEQSRDFTHVADVVEGTLRAAEDGEGLYNLGSGRRVTVNDMVDVLQQVLDVAVESEHVDQPPGDVEHTHADIGKAADELGYDPGIGFEAGAESCVTWCRQMHEKGLL